MSDTKLNEAERLREMLVTARQLAEESDPLLAGQYTLLVGQIEALLTIIAPGQDEA
ncbi:MAG: hypothetical protein QGF09_00725 [Rhodospirillales bacterium]|jgi:hypothetical protein|nr:hypothetical protein [Rhodospirillales bacterium]